MTRKSGCRSFLTTSEDTLVRRFCLFYFIYICLYIFYCTNTLVLVVVWYGWFILYLLSFIIIIIISFCIQDPQEDRHVADGADIPAAN